MLLRVGELAKRTGVTVRALHHYDSIGLLRPSARSEGGYRLYDRDDVARLHGIQTLRRLGVPLAEMTRLLGGGTRSLQDVLARQVSALDQEIASANALRERLVVMQLVFAGGGHPKIDDWLAGLALMRTYEQYFSPGELKRVFVQWKRWEAEWPPLLKDIHLAMEQGTAPDSVEIQPLVHRWIDLTTRWMDGNLEVLARWGSMLRQQPGVPLPAGMDRPSIDYMEEAIRRRMAVLARHISPEEQQRLSQTRLEWRELVQRGHRLMSDGVPAGTAKARKLRRDWQALKTRTVGDDTAFWDRLIAAYENEPLLHAGMPVTPELRRYVEQAIAP
jgi:MerR family transcriptional regulator, thiopeptide resistance regulator